eukprot:scaffold262062_cov15-Tisochrysis_lutea.AAC.1
MHGPLGGCRKKGRRPGMKDSLSEESSRRSTGVQVLQKSHCNSRCTSQEWHCNPSQLHHCYAFNQ